MCPRRLIYTAALVLGSWALPPLAPGAWADEPKPSADRQARLDEAGKLQQQVKKLLGEGKPRDALAPARRALELCREVLGEKHQDTARSLQDLAQVLQQLDDLAAARTYLEQSLAIRREVLGEKHPETGASLNNLGFLLSKLGDNAGARANYEQALAICQEALGEKHPITATLLNNLGSLLDGAGDYAAARPYYEQALAIRKEALGEKHADTVESLNNLGHLLQAQGDYAAARPYLEKSLAINRETLGPKHLTTALALNNLGSLLEDLGEFAEARTCYEQALAIKTAALGEKHPGTALALNNLGHLLSAMGDPAAARPYYERALAIRRLALGEKHPDTAQSLNNLGGLLRGLGDYAAARPYYEQALAINREVLGAKHPSTANSLNSLGLLLGDMGDYTAARRYLEQALAIRKQVLGERHPDTAGSLSNLATLREDTGDFAAALPLYQQALAIKKEALGEQHPDTARAIQNLGAMYFRVGDYAAARSSYEQALAIDRQTLGNQHPTTAVVLDNLGLLYVEMGEFEAARPLFDEALAIRQQALGERHPDTARSLENLGNYLQAKGDYAAARPYYERALVVRREALGEKHPDTAQSLHRLGWLLQMSGDYKAARPYYEQALAIRRVALGNRHPDTANSLNNLGSLFADLGDPAAARPYLEESLAISQQVLGPSNPHAAFPREHLSVILAALGQWSPAAAHMDQLRRIARRHIARVLPGLSEKEQLAFLESNDAASYHAGLTIGLLQRQDPALAALSAGWLLNDKGVAQEALAERALLAREISDPKMKEAVEQLMLVRRQLATLSMAPVPPGQEAARRERIAALEEDESTRARRLTDFGGAAARTEPWIELDAVRQAIDSDAVLVELARFWLYDFSAAPGDRPWRTTHYAAWIIPPAGQGDVRIVDLGEAKAVDQAVEAARQTFLAPRGSKKRGLVAEQEETQAEKAFREAPTKLAALVLQPVLEQTGAAKKLVICPDAALWLVPWAALPLADGRYAIQQYRFQYVISGRDLVVPAAAATYTTKPVIMADPDYDLSPAAVAAGTRAALPKSPSAPADSLALRSASADGGAIGHVQRLPGTAKEAKTIAPQLATFARAEPRLLMGPAALEGVFKQLAHPKVLVLSTHGFFLDDQSSKPAGRASALGSDNPRTALLAMGGKPLENPLLRCGLLLAGCNTRSQAVDDSGQLPEFDDGVLTGMEIIGTDLRGTDLVVLSACETGLGEVHNGEGVAGLRQAFQLAGAKAVVASLWQVPDEQTAELMGLVFTNLAAGLAKDEALRKAQLRMIESHKNTVGSEPFYWAAFTLTGR